MVSHYWQHQQRKFGTGPNRHGLLVGILRGGIRQLHGHGTIGRHTHGLVGIVGDGGPLHHGHLFFLSLVKFGLELDEIHLSTWVIVILAKRATTTRIFYYEYDNVAQKRKYRQQKGLQ